MKQKYKILLLIFSICLAASALLAFTPAEKICGAETSSCSIVQNSEYKETLGVSNSVLGLIIFTALIIITFSHARNPHKHKHLFLMIGSAASALGAAYFIFLQFFVIKAICPYCMVVDVGSILALIIIIMTRNQ